MKRVGGLFGASVLSSKRPKMLASERNRFFIRTSGDCGYGRDPAVADKAEELIGLAREKIASGTVSTFGGLENLVARQYIRLFHYNERVLARSDIGRPLDPRTGRLETVATGMMPKHFPYRQRVDAVLSLQDRQVARLSLFGRELCLVTTVLISELRGNGMAIDAPESYDGPGWIPTDDVESASLVDRRREELFRELKELARTAQPKEKVLDAVAEIEWLSAQRWRFERGTAGVQQILARALLESCEIETGPYKIDIDPNLEALTSTLEAYRALYPSIYEDSPRQI